MSQHRHGSENDRASDGEQLTARMGVSAGHARPTGASKTGNHELEGDLRGQELAVVRGQSLGEAGDCRCRLSPSPVGERDDVGGGIGERVRGGGGEACMP